MPGNDLSIGELRRRLKMLSKRELEVFEHIADGETARSVALRLGIAKATVDVHVGAVYKKLGLRNRVELAGAAHRLRLRRPEGTAREVGEPRREIVVAAEVLEYRARKGSARAADRLRLLRDLAVQLSR